MAKVSAFEVWESPDGQARFCFSHSDGVFTTGVLILQPGCELPKHNRPLAVESLVQLSGRSTIKLLDDDGILDSERTLLPADGIAMEKGQWHIHANPFDVESTTMFKADGNITDIVAELRRTYTEIVVE